jgi:glycosyltransferase involved in cell wall biosynthesis
MTKNVVLLQCAQRSGHFGQGSFVKALLPYFINDKTVSLTIVKTDALDIAQPQLEKVDGVDTILIPQLIGSQLLTGEAAPAQQYYSVKLAGILYEFFRNKPNLIFWVNTIDYLNVCIESKAVFPRLKIFYVHHSFTWKYMLNMPDNTFKVLWQKGHNEVHPKAFEMTGYQQKITLVADQTVTVTEHAKAFFTTILGTPAEKVKMIYNGVDPSVARSSKKSVLRRKYGFSKSDKILVICGRITKDKGIPDALRAFQIVAERNANLKLMIIGAGYIAEYVHLAAPYWSRVIYTGELSQSAVSEFYTLADIGVIPSLHEQCSFTAIEMRLHRLPLIVSDVDGLQEVFNHEIDALKIPLRLTEKGEKQIDVAVLASQIDLLINDHELAGRLRSNSYQKARDIFSLNNMYKGYRQLIAELMTNE